MHENHFINVKLIDVDVTEEFVMNPNGLPAPYKEWRFYRIEYGGCNQDCLVEGGIYLPPNIDASIVPQLIMGMDAYWQVWKANIDFEENPDLPEQMKCWKTYQIEYIPGEMTTRVFLPPPAEPDFLQWIVKIAKNGKRNK